MPIFKNRIFSRIFSGRISFALYAAIFSGVVLGTAAAAATSPEETACSVGGNTWDANKRKCIRSESQTELDQREYCKSNFEHNTESYFNCLKGDIKSGRTDCASAHATFKKDRNDASRDKKDAMKSSVDSMKSLTDSIQAEKEKAADKITSIQEALQKADVEFKDQQAKLVEEGQKADADLAQQKRAAQNELIKMNQQMVQMQGQLTADQSSLAMVINMGSASMIQNTCNNSVRKNAKESGINIGGSGNSNQVQSLDNMWKDCVNLATTKADGDIKSAQSKVNATKAGQDALNLQIQQTNQAIADMDLQAQKAAAARAQKMTDLQSSYTQKKANLQADLQRADINSRAKIAKAQQQMEQQRMMAVVGAASGGGSDDAGPFIDACCNPDGDGAKQGLNPVAYEGACKAAAGDVGSDRDPLKSMGANVGGAALQMWMMNGAM